MCPLDDVADAVKHAAVVSIPRISRWRAARGGAEHGNTQAEQGQSDDINDQMVKHHASPQCDENAGTRMNHLLMSVSIRKHS
jgi:hypothetical protein